MANLRQAFCGKHVLLTGHTGFKGVWAALWLIELGASVTGVSLPPDTEPNLFDIVGLKALVDHRIADIRSDTGYEDAVAGLKPDVLIHMAAQSLVLPSYADPVDTLLTNVIGTARVLDAARRLPSLRAIIVVSSDKCYENRELTRGYRETDPMGGADPYSASKGCTELVATSYRKSFFSAPDAAQLATARAGNVIGGGDWCADRLVPDIIRSLTRGTPLSIRNPDSIRPWQHVLEPISGYLHLAGAMLAGGRFGAAWNFGPRADDALTVSAVLARFETAWGGKLPCLLTPSNHRPPETQVLKLDSGKARSELNWQPTLDFGEAIEMTAQWYRAHLDGHPDMRGFTQGQIGQFSALQDRVFSGGERHAG